MNVSLLATKLHSPVVSTKLVARPRLLAWLDDGLTRSLTLISAPPGFGKTTLVSEWIQSRETSAAWLALDEDDNDLTRFLTYVIAALATLKHGIGDETLILLQAPQPPPLKTIVTSLINDLETISAPFALILDDYHVITTQPIHDAIEFLLDHLPHQMHLIILTRADPPLTLARLRARNQLVELRANDLRFSQDEASDFLKQVMRLNLSAEEIATLEARTEGWIAGLQIAALSMRAQDDVAGFVKAFTGSHRHVLDYLAEEVFKQQTQATQDFLLRTSILDRLTGALCDAVTEQTDGAQSLESLERANLFIVPLDGERRWYRYHHLFADLLRFRLNRDSPQLVSELHRRAARWLESQGDVFDALTHWLAARDFPQTIRLLESVGLGLLEHGAVPQLLGWIKQIPAEHIRASSWLNIYHAWALLLTGQFGELAARLASAERELDDPEHQNKLGHIATIRAYVAVVSEDVPRTLQLAQHARELLPPEAVSIQSIVAFILGGANLLAQDWAGAEKFFADAAKCGEQSGNLHIAIPASCALADLRATRGALHHAVRVYHDALRLATTKSGHSLPVAARALVGIGNLELERNELVSAEQHLEKSVKLSELWGNPDTHVLSHIALARLRQAQENPNDALAHLEEAGQIAQRSMVTASVQATVAAFQMRAALANGDWQSALQVAEQRGLRGDGALSLLCAVEYIAYARVLLAQGEFVAAGTLLERLYQKAEQGNRRSTMIEILILRSLLLQTQGDIAQALTMLGNALALAEPEGYVRVFIDEGEPMIELLRRAGSHGIAPRYVAKLLSAVSLEFANKDRAAQPLIEPLSEREIEILGFIAAGLSNQAIAEKLVVAIGTIKAHTASIYRKLDVASRTQAVARARDLNLI